MFEFLNKVINGYGLISGFVIIGVIMVVFYWLLVCFICGCLYGLVIVIFFGLVLFYVGGVVIGG